MSKAPQVKNRAPAPIQITAEQLLRESSERGLEEVPKPPKQFIVDKEELIQYQQTKRKDLEDQLRRQRQNIGIWCRYALWEASQLDFTRARSVFERAIEVDYRNQTLWLKYAEMEMKNKFINHARNIWDRAVTLLPRIDNFWYKYSYMEEMIGAIDNARNIFERWMAWEPDDLAWSAYIKFEVRQGLIPSARKLYERYIAQLPTARAYLKYAKWEESNNQERELARVIYERSLVELHPSEKTENLFKIFLQFAKFEERCKEYERCTVIYQYAIDQLTNEGNHSQLEEMRKEFLQFEKRRGTSPTIESAVIASRREVLERRLQEESFNYDLWLDYLALEEEIYTLYQTQLQELQQERDEEEQGEGDENDREKIAFQLSKQLQVVRSLYQRAVSQKPAVIFNNKEGQLGQQGQGQQGMKRYYQRYIYLWIHWFLFEELTVKDINYTRSLYQDCLLLKRIIPHEYFTFAKIWIMWAEFEIRHQPTTIKKLEQARKILGMSLGKAGMQLGKKKLFDYYIAWEYALGEMDRVRKLYHQYLLARPYDSEIWCGYAAFELKLGEVIRSRGIYELALQQEVMDVPEN